MVDRNRSVASQSLYRTIWRWHFYAGLLTLPFLVMMAITGGAYLFKSELDHFFYRKIEEVPARATPFAPFSQVIARVESQLHGRVLEFTPAASPTRAVRLMARIPSGEVLTVFANPYEGTVTGTMPYGGVMQLVRKIHGLQKFDFWASCLIELTAGWTLLLIGMGVFLWWPRGAAKGGVMTVRGTPRERVFWRDLHAVTGILASVVILFLAVTGMPWSMFWGDHFQQWATQNHLNKPVPPAAVTPSWLMTATIPNMPHAPHVADATVRMETPWAMERTVVPMSATSGITPIGIDRAVARFRQLGVAHSAAIALPEGPKGAYVATWEPGRAEDTRVVYLDQYSGRVLGDVGFKQWGPAAKVTEWGIAVHQGQEYGGINRYVMLLGCIAILLMAASSVTMWWKRRPRGTWGVPPAPPTRGAAKGFLSIVVAVGVLFPLVGASILVAWCVEAVGSTARRAT